MNDVQEQEESPTLSIDPIERWFRELFVERNEDIATAALAMIDDGYEHGTAWLMACVGYLRYCDEPLSAVATAEYTRWALSKLQRSIGPACQEAHAAPRPGSRSLRPSFQPDFKANALDAQGSKVKVLCSTDFPRTMLMASLLSDQECDELIALARPHLKDSPVISAETGELMVDTEWRISRSARLPQPVGELQARIEARVASLVGLPVSHCEGMSVAAYGVGGKVKSHHDYFPDAAIDKNAANGPAGQRIATVLLYLNDAEAGGGTLFNDLGLTVRPTKGNAMYFEYQFPDGTMDISSLHSAEPVLRGEKWIATLLFREGPVERRANSVDDVAGRAATGTM